MKNVIYKYPPHILDPARLLSTGRLHSLYKDPHPDHAGLFNITSGLKEAAGWIPSTTKKNIGKWKRLSMNLVFCVNQIWIWIRIKTPQIRVIYQIK